MALPRVPVSPVFALLLHFCSATSCSSSLVLKALGLPSILKLCLTLLTQLFKDFPNHLTRMLLPSALWCEEVVWYGEKVLQISFMVVVVVSIGLHLKRHHILFKTKRNSSRKQPGHRIANENLLDHLSSQHCLPQYSPGLPPPSPYSLPNSGTSQKKILNNTPPAVLGTQVHEPSQNFEDFILFPPANTSHHNKPSGPPPQFCSCHPLPSSPQQQERPRPAWLIPTITYPISPIPLSTISNPSTLPPSASTASQSPPSPGQCHCLPTPLLNIGLHLSLSHTPPSHLSQCTCEEYDENLDLDLELELEMGEVRAMSIDEYISRRTLRIVDSDAEDDGWGFMR